MTSRTQDNPFGLSLFFASQFGSNLFTSSQTRTSRERPAFQYSAVSRSELIIQARKV